MKFLVIAAPIIIVALVLVVFLISIYKVARVDQALIITGGKKPKIIVSGGGFVIPIFRKYSFFDMCISTVRAVGDEIKTTTGVPVVVDWTAQIRPDPDEKQLQLAATSFLERGPDDIVRDVKLTLDGGVREVVASMKPEQVLREKEEFSRLVRLSVSEEMKNLGFTLVSLNIQDVTDKNGYFANLAASDREGRRREAENITAEANQAVREKIARSNQSATEAELAAELAIAGKTRDNEVQRAEYKAETERARADADIAGELQATARQRDLATQRGQVQVEEQVQANLAAQKRKEVIQTEAEAQRVKVEIDASASAGKLKIEAAARASVMETEAVGKANAAKKDAEGDAVAIQTMAEGEAQATKARAEAAAAKTRQEGVAEAEIITKKGLAEAEAIKAKMLAEAEGEKALADARAAHEGVNLKVTLAEIEQRARIEIATNAAKVMTEIGRNAKFVDLGAGTGKDSNVLFDSLRHVPTLLEQLDVANRAITSEGEAFNETIRKTVESIVSPLLGNGTEPPAPPQA
jgi:flotillin